MLDLALVTVIDDENPDVGDLMIRDGQLVMVEGRDAIAQDLSVCLRWFKDEWFLDRRLGLPWFQRILGHEEGAAIAEVVLRHACLQRPGISTVERCVVTVDTEARDLLVDLAVRSIDGDVIEVPAFFLGDLVEAGL